MSNEIEVGEDTTQASNNEDILALLGVTGNTTIHRFRKLITPRTITNILNVTEEAKNDSTLMRLRSMCYELLLAILSEKDNIIDDLKREYLSVERYSEGLKEVGDIIFNGGSGGNAVELANNLTTTEQGKALDAVQGKVLNDKIEALDIPSGGSGEIVEIANNYTTTETGKALDAVKGKDLNDRLVIIEQAEGGSIEAVTAIIPTGTTLPETAYEGEYFLNTEDAKLYTATDTNTWDNGQLLPNKARYASSTDNKIYESDGVNVTGVAIPTGFMFYNKSERLIYTYDDTADKFVKVSINYIDNGYDSLMSYIDELILRISKLEATLGTLPQIKSYAEFIPTYERRISSLENNLEELEVRTTYLEQQTGYRFTY